MTKKDYELIASIITKEYDRAQHLAGYHKDVDEWTAHRRWTGHAEGVHQVALNLAFELSKENPRFDEKRFFEACGIN